MIGRSDARPNKLSTPRRSDRARAAERAGNVDDDEEDRVRVPRVCVPRVCVPRVPVPRVPAPPRPATAHTSPPAAGCVQRDEPTAPVSPNAPARSTTTRRERSATCASRAEARRRGTRRAPPW